jgi:hypothetical protein
MRSKHSKRNAADVAPGRKLARRKNGGSKKRVSIEIKYRGFEFRAAFPERVAVKTIRWLIWGVCFFLMLKHPELGQMLRYHWPI